MDKVLDVLQRIESLCTTPHWTGERKERIVELVNEARKEINQYRWRDSK